MKKAYVGVTGPVTPMEATGVAVMFDASSRDPGKYRPMIGYLVSYRTLKGTIVSNRRYPGVDQIPLMAERVANVTRLNGPLVFQTVHYNNWSSPNGSEMLGEELERLFQMLGRSTPITGVQLNISWPFADEIARFKDVNPEVEIIFQANSKVLGYKRQKDSFNHEAVAERISLYGGLVDHVLIDASGGAGTTMNVRSSAAFGKAISEAHPDVRVGYAGGLCGENVERIVRGIEKRLGHRNFSLDAEGKLRDKISAAYGDDCLNEDYTQEYIEQSYNALMGGPYVEPHN